MNDLKSCPFCGSNQISRSFDVVHYIGCGECKILFVSESEKFEESWNHRPSPWISVKDRLPEKIEGLPYLEVLIFIDSDPCEIRIATLEYNEFYDEWEWFDINQLSKHSLMRSDEVTHWQPLPNPPKENE